MAYPNPTCSRPERAAIAERYNAVRARTVALIDGLSPEDMQVQSMPDASPAKWHLAHTTWFFEVFVIGLADLDHTPFDPRFGFLFNSYYDAVGPRAARFERGLVTRPSVDEILTWRAYVDAAMNALFERASDDELVNVPLGLAHEEQHQELLLMDLKHAFSRNPFEPAYRAHGLQTRAEAQDLTWTSHPGGKVFIGHCSPDFAFDNEGPEHAVWLEPFCLADRLVTCGEWLAFMADGGYAEPRWWLSDGWTMVQSQGWTAPEYWRNDDGGWTIFTLSGRRAVDPAEPVCHVSFYEADAFAHWSGMRLPTEAEWEIVARGTDIADGGRLHPATAVHPGPGQFAGEVWQWTASAYSPYPRYRPAEGAIGEYNGKFMSGQMVLRGGAAITAPGHTRATYRNFFPPATRWAFSGVRLANHV